MHWTTMYTRARLAVMVCTNMNGMHTQAGTRPSWGKVLVPGLDAVLAVLACGVQVKVRCEAVVPACRVKHSKVLVKCSSAGAVAVLVLVPWKRGAWVQVCATAVLCVRAVR